MPELDGVRGLAVLMVVAAHSWNGMTPANRRLFGSTSNFSGGGWLGVQLFFVLSGYLITGILLREVDERGAIRLGRFYVRRARRLIPALVLICATYLVVVLVAREGEEVERGLGSIARALLYIENLDPLADRILPADVYLDHTWSLAVEEQFYLVWPLLLFWCRRWTRVRLAWAVTIAIVAVVAARHILAGRGFSVYERMHWDALLVGCLIAITRPRVPTLAGWCALAVTAWLLWSSSTEELGASIFLITAVIGGCVVATAQQMPWLANSVLRYFGRISYGLYLWNTFLLRFAWHAIPTFVVSVIVAELSFRLVERRFLAAT